VEIDSCSGVIILSFGRSFPSLCTYGFCEIDPSTCVLGAAGRPGVSGDG
jgi:hypothetical protein